MMIPCDLVSFVGAATDLEPSLRMTVKATSRKPVPEVTLRPVTQDDEAFLFKVYASSREDELAMVEWLEIERRTFLQMQFKLQRDHYKEMFPKADHVIILLNGQPAGRMMVDRTRADELHGVDIAILPEFRNGGAGSYLIEELLREARAAGKPFRIQVERINQKAMRLYERLGFSYQSETPTHIALEWTGKPEKTNRRRGSRKKHAKAKRT